MTRGTLIFLTDEGLYYTKEFNGNMDCEGYGKEVLKELKKIKSIKDFTLFVTEFNEKNFHYPKPLIDGPVPWKKVNNEDLLNFADAYFKKWSSDYLYIKNSTTLKTFTLVDGVFELDHNEIGITHFGKSAVMAFTCVPEQAIEEAMASTEWYIHSQDKDYYLLYPNNSYWEEDFFLEIDATDIDGFVKEIVRYCYDFDPDEHVEIWVQARSCNNSYGIPGIRQLIEEADRIHESLDKLASDILEWKKEYKKREKLKIKEPDSKILYTIQEYSNGYYSLDSLDLPEDVSDQVLELIEPYCGCSTSGDIYAIVNDMKEFTPKEEYLCNIAKTWLLNLEDLLFEKLSSHPDITEDMADREANETVREMADISLSEYDAICEGDWSLAYDIHVRQNH